MTQPPYPPPPHFRPEPPKRSSTLRWVILGGVAAAAIIAGVIGNLSNGPTTPTGAPITATAVRAVTPPTTVSPADRQITVPSLVGLTGDEASAALGAAGALDIRFAQNKAPMSSKVIIQNPGPGTRQRAGSAVHLTLEVPPPAPPKEINSRDWQLIARTPDAHIGERIVVFGQVTQFDSATGVDTFRANVDGVKHPVRYGYADYETNTVLSGTSAVLGDLVKDDLFRAEATVLGSLSYATTMGGSTTVPSLEVSKIEVIGSAK